MACDDEAAADDDAADGDDDTAADDAVGDDAVGDHDAAVGDDGKIYVHRWPLQSHGVHVESCQIIALICPDDR